MPKLSETELQQALASLPGWTVEADNIAREFKFKDFVGALGFIAQATGRNTFNLDAEATMQVTFVPPVTP